MVSLETQLTMRTFHTGGVDLRKASQSNILSTSKGKVKFPKTMEFSTITENKKKSIILTKDAVFTIENNKIDTPITLPKGSVLQVKDGANVKKEDIIALYDSSSNYVESMAEGEVKLYKNEEEIEIAIFDKSKKATIEVSLEKAKTYKKYDRLSHFG